MPTITIKNANFTYYVPGTTEEVEAWATAIQANSGTVSQEDIDSVNTFVLGTKQDGIFDKFLAFNPFAGDNKAAALVPVVGGAAWTDAEDNVAYGSNGFTFENNESIETTLSPNTLFPANTNASIHSWQVGPTGAGYAIDISAGSTAELTSKLGNGNVQVRLFRGVLSADAGGNTGLISASTDTTNTTLYRNGVSVSTDSAALVGLPSTPFSIGQRAGLTTGYATSTIGMVLFAEALNASEIQLLYNRAQTLMTALGR